jgi:uncharacterized membrane protein
MTKHILIAIFILFAFLAGCFVGTMYSNRQIAKCQEEKRVLTEDLTKAVKRGVLMEANFNLCRERESKK